MKVLLCLLLLWPGVATADPVRDWINTQPEAYQGFLARIYSSSRLMSYVSACPADVFATRRARAKGSKDCVSYPGLCLVECQIGNGDACFGAARVIETELDGPGDATLKFPLFMAACADGNANGCTNAGATAKNGSWIETTRPTTARSRSCQFASYDLACNAGAAWGCYMLGLEWVHEHMDGGPDPVAARVAWQRSCDLVPEGSACLAAMALLEDY